MGKSVVIGGFDNHCQIQETPQPQGPRKTRPRTPGFLNRKDQEIKDQEIKDQGPRTAQPRTDLPQEYSLQKIQIYCRNQTCKT